MFQTKVVEKIKTHFVFGNFFSKSRHLFQNVEKYCRSRNATNDNTASLNLRTRRPPIGVMIPEAV